MAVRIGGFRGVREDINPGRMEVGHLQAGENLRFVRAGELRSMRADSQPYTTLTVNGVGTLISGLHQIRNPYSGYLNYIFKAGTKIYLAVDVDDLGYVNSFSEVLDTGSETPISVFSVDDWVYIYDSAGSKKWNGAVGGSMEVYDLDAGADYSTLEATINVSGVILRNEADTDRYYMCVRPFAHPDSDLRIDLISPAWRLPYCKDGATWVSRDAAGGTEYWKPIAVHESAPGGVSAWSGAGVSYAATDRVYLTGTDLDTSLTDYYELECVTSHTSVSTRTNLRHAWAHLWKFYWAALDGHTSDYTGKTYPDWTSTQPDSWAVARVILVDNQAVPLSDIFGSLDSFPFVSYEAAEKHGADGIYFYRYRYVLMALNSQGDPEYPLYAQPFQDITASDSALAVTAGAVVRIDYDLATVSMVGGHGRLMIEVFRSADGGGYNDLQLLRSVSANPSGADTEGSFYDSTRDIDLGAPAGPYEIDFIAPPESSIAAFAAQRVFVADGRRLYWSYPGFPGRFNALQQASLNDTITAIVEWAEDVYFFTPSALWVYKPVDAIGVLQRTGSNVGCSHGSAVVATRDAIYFTRPDGVWRFNGGSSDLISNPMQKTWDDASDVFSPVMCHTGRRLFAFRGTAGITAEMIHGSSDWCSVSRTFMDTDDDEIILGAQASPEGHPVILSCRNIGGSNYEFNISYMEREKTSSIQVSRAVTGEIRAPRNNHPVAVSFSYEAESDITATIYVRNQLGAVSSQEITLPATSGLTRFLRNMMPYSMIGESLWFEVEGTGFVLDDILVEAL